MTTLYVGDLHGYIDPLSAIDIWAAKNGVDTVIQVGDFGAFWPGRPCDINKYFIKRARKKRLGPRWIVSPGNHDNWDRFDLSIVEETEPGDDPPSLVEMAPDLFYARRGTTAVIDGHKHLFFGGATSTDQHHRTAGLSWWAREQPSTSEFETFFTALETEKPDIVITHECPSRVQLYRVARDRDPVACGLESALAISEHKPRLWFFGHHHVLQKWDIEGTSFMCCGLHGDYWKLKDDMLSCDHASSNKSDKKRW